MGLWGGERPTGTTVFYQAITTTALTLFPILIGPTLHHLTHGHHYSTLHRAALTVVCLYFFIACIIFFTTNTSRQVGAPDCLSRAAPPLQLASLRLVEGLITQAAMRHHLCWPTLSAITVRLSECHHSLQHTTQPVMDFRRTSQHTLLANYQAQIQQEVVIVILYVQKPAIGATVRYGGPRSEPRYTKGPFCSACVPIWKASQFSSGEFNKSLNFGWGLLGAPNYFAPSHLCNQEMALLVVRLSV